MRRLIWVGDACVATGFARATQYILDTLKDTWEVHLLGLHYSGDPYVSVSGTPTDKPYDWPYPIYPTKYDTLGVRRLPLLCEQLQPDLIVLQNDVWNIAHYMKVLKKKEITTPVVAALAVDGRNLQAKKLEGIALAIFWTKFAQEEARLGGWDGPTAVVPLGVDLDIYKLKTLDHIVPLRKEARSYLHSKPERESAFDIEGLRNGFIVLNVNRNQQRKRFDLTVQYFCEWVLEKNISDAFLMVHACPTGEHEYDISQLMDYYGLLDRLFLIHPDKEFGVPESDLVWTYRCADVGITTTQGEGFGLPTFEMMAVGVPQIVPAWSALDELCEDAALKVPCTGIAATQGGVNVLGGIADRDKFIEALDLLYRDSALRQTLIDRGLALVRQDRYRWPVVGQQFRDALDSVGPLELGALEDPVEVFRAL